MDGRADDDLGGGGGGATEVVGGGWAVLVAVFDLVWDGCGRCGGVTVRVAVVSGSTREGCGEVAGGVEDGAADVPGGDDTTLTAEPALVRPEDEHEVRTSVIATIAAAGRDQRVINCRCAGRSSRAGSAVATSARRVADATSLSTRSRR